LLFHGRLFELVLGTQPAAPSKGLQSVLIFGVSAMEALKVWVGGKKVFASFRG
jgi:hypothetical protein